MSKTIRLTDEVWGKLKAAGKAAGESMSEMVGWLLEEQEKEKAEQQRAADFASLDAKLTALDKRLTGMGAFLDKKFAALDTQLTELRALCADTLIDKLDAYTYKPAKPAAKSSDSRVALLWPVVQQAFYECRSSAVPGGVAAYQASNDIQDESFALDDEYLYSIDPYLGQRTNWFYRTPELVSYLQSVGVVIS